MGPKRIKKARLLIVDDHPVLRQGLKALINREADLRVCGEAEDVTTGLALVEELKPDLVIIDISLKGRSGLELMRDVNLRHPNLPTLALSMHEESAYAERVLRAGASGYVMKKDAAASVVEAIRRVLKGEVFLSGPVAGRMLRKFVKGRSSYSVETLTDRELEVFGFIGHGFAIRDIAERLNLSSKTVDVHRANIKDKLNVKTSNELLQIAVQWVLSEAEAGCGR
ncbi:response regulator [Planctomycetota bacterium]